MTGFLLDTNACILFLNGKSEPLQQKITQNLADIYLCDVVIMELFYGAYKSQHVTKNLAKVESFSKMFPILTFNEQIAKISGEIRANLAKQGTPIGAYDVLIASTALYYDKIVITHNVKEFSRVTPLTWRDWQMEN